MKLKRIDKIFLRINIWLMCALGMLVIVITVYAYTLTLRTPLSDAGHGKSLSAKATKPKASRIHESRPSSMMVNNPSKREEELTLSSRMTTHLKKVDTPELALFTLDFWYADDTLTIAKNTTCSSVTPLMAEYIATTIKSAWERIPGDTQLRFKTDKWVFCQMLTVGDKDINTLYLTQGKHETVFFSMPKHLAKPPKAIRGAFWRQLFALAERQFGKEWAAEWDTRFGQPTADTTLLGFGYANSRQERADWFRFLLQDKDTVFNHVSVSKNTMLLDKLMTMQTLLNDEWQIELTFVPVPTSTVTIKSGSSSGNQSRTQSSATRRAFDILMAKNRYQGIRPIKNLTAAEAEKVFGIRGLQFAPNNFAPDLPFKLGFAHSDVDVFGNTCKSSTPINSAMSGRHIANAWKKLPTSVQQRLGLKFVFFCREIVAKNGAKMGGLATSFHDTVFIRIPNYNVKDGKFIQKVFLHELFHYSEFRERLFFNHPWDNVFSGYANAYRQDLANSRIGSGRRGFLNAYSMTFSAEERAELFSELMMNAETVIRFAKRHNDTVLMLKIARMQQIMRINWGVN